MGKCASNEYWIRSGSLNIKSVDCYNSLKEGLNERLNTSPTKKLKMLKEDLEHFRDNQPHKTRRLADMQSMSEAYQCPDHARVLRRLAAAEAAGVAGFIR